MNKCHFKQLSMPKWELQWHVYIPFKHFYYSFRIQTHCMIRQCNIIIDAVINFKKRREREKKKRRR